MVSYNNNSGNSGIMGYEIGDECITVWFSGNGRSYSYSYDSAGVYHVEHMKGLAMAGSGLNSYINKFVRDKYVR